jgi:phage-related minor tail protein
VGAVGEAFMWTLAISVGAVAAVVGVAVAAVVALGAAWDGMAKAGTAAWNALKSGVTSAIDAIRAIDLAEVGASMIDGLVKGIESKAGSLVSALTGVVGQGVMATRSALDSHSPSRVFAELGEFTGEGYAMGVEDSTPQVESAVRDMVDPPALKSGDDAPSRAGSVGPITINIHGVQGIEDALDKLERAVDDIFAGKALAMGATA